MRLKKFFYLFIHLFFLSGILYAFYYFIGTPKTDMLDRRLWAYETWIILCFYGCFVYLTSLSRTEIRGKIRVRVDRFREILTFNLFLLIFPWGLFLITAPSSVLAVFGFRSFYWRILGIGSLIGALIYSIPLKFYKKRLTRYVLIFGFVDNLVAGAIVSFLYFRGQVPLVAFSAVPLLLYYASFFLTRARKFKLKKL